MKIMIQGTTSGAGKSVITTALCRIFADMGFSVAPFKSQNMSRFLYGAHGSVISRAQAIQALAARTAPVPDMNPILLRPEGDSYSTVYLGGRIYRKMDAVEYHTAFALKRGLGVAMAALRRLEKNFDIIVIEGAGSPAEINMQKYDIANMAIASRARAPVLLVSDIERGGAFAAIAGTLSLLEAHHAKLIAGFIINKFTGSKSILEPGLTQIRRITGKRVLGVIPKAKLDIPGEDSLDGAGPFTWNRRNMAHLSIQIDKLASIISRNLDMRAVQRAMR